MEIKRKITVELNKEDENIAIKAAKFIKSDICAVDLLDGGNGLKVIEINLSPGVEGITKATNKNVAREIARFLFEKSKEFKRMKTEGDYFEMIRDLDKENRVVETNLDIKIGRIILPSRVSDLSKFKSGDKVEIESVSGKVVIKRR